MTAKTEFERFADWALEAQAQHQLHRAVQGQLCRLLAKEFPNNAAIAEVSAVKGGRNDLIHYQQDGKYAVFELFASTSQVPQDLRLLEQADAHWKIAILLDPDLRADLAETYFRKKPDAFPYVWLSQVMMPAKETECRLKLRQLLTMPPLHVDEPLRRVSQKAKASGRSIIAQTVEGHIHINQKQVVRPTFAREPGDITDEQASRIKSLLVDLAQIDEAAGRGNTYGKWQNHFKNTFHITSYKKLPVDRFKEALSWLLQQKGRSLPKLRRTNHAEWQKANYKTIWTIARDVGLSRDEVYRFAFTELELKKPITSLKELGEQKLTQLRDKLRYLKRKFE